jgi:hypothetical protein
MQCEIRSPLTPRKIHFRQKWKYLVGSDGRFLLPLSSHSALRGSLGMGLGGRPVSISSPGAIERRLARFCGRGEHSTASICKILNINRFAYWISNYS